MERASEGQAAMLELIYAETVRRLNLQLQNLAGLRARAGTLFGAAAVTTSLLAGLAANAERVGEPLRLGTAGWIAVASFVLAMLITFLLFGNLPQLSFTLQRRSVEDLLTALPELPITTSADAYREMTIRLESVYAENAQTMKLVFALMWLLVAAVGVELLAWLAVLM